MARILLCVCILLLGLGWQQQSANANPIMAATKAIKFAYGVYEDIQKIKKMLEPEETEDMKISKVDVQMFEKLDSISDDIKDLKEDLIQRITGDLQSKLSVKTTELFKHVRDIQRMYQKFLKYVKDLDKIQERTLSDFTNQVTTSSLVELSATVEKMHEEFVGVDINHETILTILSDKKNPQLMCLRHESPQQVIHDIYKTVVTADTRSLAIKLFAYERKEILENATYKYEKDEAIKEFENRVQKTYGAVKSGMVNASREVWRCDPAQYTKDTYSKIQEVFQVYVNYEADFTGHGSYRAFTYCDKKCEEFQDAHTQYCDSDYCNNQRYDRRCTGKIRECKSIHHKMTLCNAPEDSDRRYDWLETDNEIKYGRKQHCAGRSQVIESKTVRWFLVCEYCVCTCESERKEIRRYFSLRKTLADTDKNYVVTGVRFKVYRKNVFYIEIQQGQLGPNGTIVSSVDWQPAQKINKKRLLSGAAPVYKVDWDHKAVYLDDLEPKTKKSSKNRLVTGLMLKQVEKDLQLQVQTMEFNYATGKLNHKSARWHSNNTPRSERTPVSLSGADNPLMRKNHLADSQSGQYVEFQTTDLKKDLGQYTIPFIDTQDVKTNLPLPLAGVGIFHKGAKESGGFLALKVMQYDFTKHL